MLRTLQHPHLRPVLNGLKYTTTAASAVTIDRGSSLVTATYNDVSDATLTFPRDFERSLMAVTTPETAVAAGSFSVVTTADTNDIRAAAKTAAGATAAAHGAVHTLALAYDSESLLRAFPHQAVKSFHAKTRLMGFHVASNAISKGFSQAVLTNTSTGLYTFGFMRSFGSNPVVVACPIAAAQKACNISTATVGGAAINTYNSSEALEANDFYMLVFGLDSTYEQAVKGRTVQVPNLAPRLEAFVVDGTGTASITTGTGGATLTDNGGSGDYTLTFANPFKRAPICIASGNTIRAQIASAATTTAVNVLTFNAAGAATDGVFHLFVLGFDYPGDQ